METMSKIINGDCITELRKIKSNTIDVVFADPPFNLNKQYSTYQDNIPFDDYLKWTDEWITECIRVLKPSGSIFVYNIPKLLTYTSQILNTKAYFRHWIAWKSNGRPLGKTLQPSHYGILYYVKDKKKFKYNDVRKPHDKCRKCKTHLKDYGGKEHLRHRFGTLVSDVWDDIHRVRHNKRRILSHPCQLPVHLIERIVLLSTDPGDLVLDPFLGAGTTAMACKRLGRACIGIDMDLSYTKLASERVEKEAQTIYQGVFVSTFLNEIVSIRDKDIAVIKNNETGKPDSSFFFSLAGKQKASIERNPLVYA